MKYTDFLKQEHQCPFCGVSQDRVLSDQKHAYLTYAIAPYHEHHLLVVPKRHVTDFSVLDDGEWFDMQRLIRRATDVLRRLGHTNVSLLMRNGDKTEKSIDHTHLHVIPDSVLGDLSGEAAHREVLNEMERDVLVKEMRSLLEE